MRKVPIGLRIDEDKLERFKELNPWTGSITGFFAQCLDEYLQLAEGQPTPAQLTAQAAQNVRRSY